MKSLTLIALIALAGCGDADLEPIPEPGLELEVLCGDAGFYEVRAHKNKTTFTRYDRGYCPVGYVCNAGFNEVPCEEIDL